jgi:hypothetical protein
VKFTDAVEKYRSLRQRNRRWLRFVLPLVALISGFGGVVLFRRGVQFAPVVAASVLFAWTLAAAIGRWFPERPDASRFGKATRWLASSVVASLFQDALFFLLPLWFGSATWPSLNMITPLLLGGMAILSCFEELYLRVVLSHPAVRATFSGIILFATLCAAIPVLLSVPLGPSVAIAALLSTILAAVAVIPPERLRRKQTAGRVTIAAIAAAAGMYLFAPLLPPVPVQCMSSIAARAIADKEPVEPAKIFPAGLPRIYVHFAVAAPPNFSERVRFRWAHEGEAMKKEFETQITGGRKSGFRTWGYATAPRPGRWTVELYAESGQLIGRERFVVSAE